MSLILFNILYCEHYDSVLGETSDKRIIEYGKMACIIVHATCLELLTITYL